MKHLSRRISRRTAGLAGLAAVALYVGATAVGGLLDPSYSQLTQHVSDLTATDAPNRWLLAWPYFAYNGATLLFAWGVRDASPRTRLDGVAFALLAANAVAGVMMLAPFAEDLGGTPRTFAGRGHLWFAGVSSATIVVASFVHGVLFRRASWRGLSAFSFSVGGAFLVLGPLAVVATARGTWAGLAERGPIGLFLLWLGVVSVSLLGAEPPPSRVGSIGEESATR